VLPICDRVYSLKLGKIAFDGVPSDLQDNAAKLKELFL
ncbi:MAG: ABC transporter ATP-binding protein, partial [Planctomycetes bacterium]|nr:ABC transporter ATP-binding protein [Planctomycetota bacterium]